MDNNNSFVKIDDEEKFKYIWCVICKRYNKKLEELLKKIEIFMKKQRRLLNIKMMNLRKEYVKKDIRRILNDENFRNKFLAKK